MIAWLVLNGIPCALIIRNVYKELWLGDQYVSSKPDARVTETVDDTVTDDTRVWEDTMDIEKHHASTPTAPASAELQASKASEVLAA